MMIRVEGLVWCHTHTTVHADTLDPYGTGTDECLAEQQQLAPDTTRDDVFVPIFMEAP